MFHVHWRKIVTSEDYSLEQIQYKYCTEVWSIVKTFSFYRLDLTNYMAIAKKRQQRTVCNLYCNKFSENVIQRFFLFLLYFELYKIEQPMFRNKYLYTKKFCEIYGTLSLKSWSMHIALGGGGDFRYTIKMWKFMINLKCITLKYILLEYVVSSA